MEITWIESVKKTKKLLIFNDMVGGKWFQIFNPTLLSFNKLRLGVTAVNAKDADSANVIMKVSSGGASYKHFGQELNANFDGNSFHGYTMLLQGESSHLLEKAVVFLPLSPKAMAGYKDSGETLYEEADVNQMRVIAVHELVHACGLDNDEHDKFDGLFQARLVPSGGKMESVMKTKGSKAMPPMYLTPSTKSKIQRLWK